MRCKFISRGQFALAVFLTMAAAGRSEAQAIVYGDTIVELLGLRTWTPQQVEAAVKQYAPELSLASAACAVILRDSIGFADAAVMTYAMPGDTIWTVIPLIEPADSMLVKYTRGIREERALPDRWLAVDSLLSANPRLASYFQHPEFLLDGAGSIYGRIVPDEAHDVRRVLRTLATEDDYAQAIDILQHASNTDSRQVAALVASNFADRDDTWHALVESFRAGSDHASSLAQMVFRALSRSGRYQVDWSGTETSLEAVIGGTNLFAYGTLLSGLVDTGVAPEQARRLSRVNPELLVDHATAITRFVRSPARQFLVHAGVPNPDATRAELLEWISRP